MTTSSARSLLIVDDDPGVRRALKRLLRKEGYEIHSASDAQTADRILEQDEIDVILCDQDMPGRKGLEFLKDAARRYPHQGRLLISGRFQSDEVALAMDAGDIHKFMMKPWEEAILKADIRASFRRIMTDYANAAAPGQQADPLVSGVPPSGDAAAWAEFDENRRMSRELHTAAGDGTLALQYQPQIELETESVVGLEALLRWNASTGPVSPEHFIALAERGGAMSKLTHWVIGEVCHRAKQWLPLWTNAKIGLNISPVDLNDDALVDHVETTLTGYGLQPSSIVVEVTESQALRCDAPTLARLERLADFGIELAIDDFGAGATSLSYLADLPFTTLKLDRSLTQQLTDDKGVTVVRKILEMARGLGMKTTVEGIETEEQAHLALSLGADVAQGYYFAKPKSRNSVSEWLAAGRVGGL
ncbi:MAG: EAL domain-containing response regulator [Pseudomonadota bacterium]